MNTFTEIFFCFGTENIITFSIDPDRPQAAAECRQIAGEIRSLCERYDAMLSVFRAGSEISRVNHAAGKYPVCVSPECFRFLREAEKLAELSSFFFDPFIRPLSELWDEAFLNGNDFREIPGALITERAALCRRSRLVRSASGCSVMLPEKGMGIDPGGIAKGYVLDRIKALPEGTTVCLGGSIAVSGRAAVPLRDPFHPDAGPMGNLVLENQKAVTSGTCERFLPDGGRNRSHILDRRTGLSADSGIVSVTLVGENGAELDAFATASVICGPKTFEDHFCRNGIEYLYITEDGKVFCSEDLYKQLELF